MKNSLTIISVVFFTANLWAQSPGKISYQAVIRNSSDQLVTEQTIGMQISILQGSATGTPVYAETQAPTSNNNGLVTLEIGSGTTSDIFSDIDWSEGPYFIKTETDPTGGTNYTITSTSQLLSVPYALFANIADSIDGGITETDPHFNAWNKSTGISITESQISDLQTYLIEETDPHFIGSTANGINGSDTANWNNKQNQLAAGSGILISGNTISIKKNPFYMGQDTLGGIVFYIYLDSLGVQHGLVISKTQSGGAWQSTSTATGANRSWDGAYNTNLMSNSPAKTFVESLGAGWYIPSIDELSLIWHNRLEINKALNKGGNTLLAFNSYYWSSTERDLDNAYVFRSADGIINGGGTKSNSYAVRGVKAF